MGDGDYNVGFYFMGLYILLIEALVLYLNLCFDMILPLLVKVLFVNNHLLQNSIRRDGEKIRGEVEVE